MSGLNSDFVDFDLYSSFYGLVRQIPVGKLSTYGALARALGDVVASRACGYMLSINPDPVGTPCYKVVRSDGDVGKFTHPDGSAEKIRRLGQDGIKVTGNIVDDFDAVLFEDFRSDHPLKSIREEQERMASSVVRDDDFSPGTIAAVDVSYDDDFGYGAMVIERNGQIEKRHTVMPVRFPYIPGYLSYREYKFIRELAQDFDGLLLVDANGYLHPRHIGLASFAGLMLDLPTIGVAKSILTGKPSGRWVVNSDEKLAYMINRRTIVSVGNRISLDSAVSLLKTRFGEKYPGLLKLAHEETVKLRIKESESLRQK